MDMKRKAEIPQACLFFIYQNTLIIILFGRRIR